MPQCTPAQHNNEKKKKESSVELVQVKVISFTINH
jgi:hypothetical protein